MNITVPEIIILQSGAIVLGFVIHHFLFARKKLPVNQKDQVAEMASANLDLKMQLTTEVDMRDREIRKLKAELNDALENNKIYEIEIEERSREMKKFKNKNENSPAEKEAVQTEIAGLKQQLADAMEDNNILQIEVEERIKEVKELKAELSKAPAPAATSVGVTNNAAIDELKKKLTFSQEDNEILQTEIEELRKQIRELKQASTQPGAAVVSGGYYEQLQQAQQSLRQENERISRLLEQIDIIKEKEEKEKEIRDENAALNDELIKLKQLLGEKETEINSIQQKATLTREMSSMLDNAYQDFHTLQEKMQKLEVQVMTSRMTSMELDDLKEAHYRLTKDYEEQKLKLNSANNDKQQYFRELTETEEKLKEANFQRQQLQKKVAYLEELTRDLHIMAEANKKLENQIKRIGELESLLNIAEEEREELKKQMHKPG